jgi:hypothetical protein
VPFSWSRVVLLIAFNELAVEVGIGTELAILSSGEMIPTMVRPSRNRSVSIDGEASVKARETLVKLTHTLPRF